MSTIGMSELRTILVGCAGAEHAPQQPADEEFAGTSFEELGYDSLVLLECAARIEQEHGISVPEGDVFEAGTPAALLDAVHAAALTAKAE